VHKTEHRGVRANSESEHENSRNGEARRFNQLPESESEVSNHIYQV
jgi:hypothetical protein